LLSNNAYVSLLPVGLDHWPPYKAGRLDYPFCIAICISLPFAERSVCVETTAFWLMLYMGDYHYGFSQRPLFVDTGAAIKIAEQIQLFRGKSGLLISTYQCD